MNIRVDLNYAIKDGTEVVFRSPVDCSQVTGLKVYYRENGISASKEFVLADAHGNNVGDIDHLFAENVVVKVILDVTTGMAYVQNADTNAYIERTFVKTVNGRGPDANGNVQVEGTSVTIDPNLKIGGAAADAKSVGDRIGDLAKLETKDTSNLVAAINEVARKGGTGAGGEVFVPKAQVTQTANGATITITDQHGTSTATITNGKDGADGYTPIKGKDYFDGQPGKDGSNGSDGVSPTVAVSKSGKVTTVSITDKNGTKTATINDGADGPAGSAGKDGTSVTVKSVSESTADGGSNVVTFSDGKTVTIKNGSKGSTGAAGTNGKDGKTPVKGTDYFTAADKAEMVQAVISALPVYAGEVL